MEDKRIQNKIVTFYGKLCKKLKNLKNVTIFIKKKTFNQKLIKNKITRTQVMSLLPNFVRIPHTQPPKRHWEC